MRQWLMADAEIVLAAMLNRSEYLVYVENRRNDRKSGEREREGGGGGGRLTDRHRFTETEIEADRQSD